MVVFKSEESSYSSAHRTHPAGPHHDPRSSRDASAPDQMSFGTDQGPAAGAQIPSGSSLPVMRPVPPAAPHEPTSAFATPIRLTPFGGSFPTSPRPHLPDPPRPLGHMSPVASLPPSPRGSFPLPSNVTPFGSQSFIPTGPAPPRPFQRPLPFQPFQRFGVLRYGPQFPYLRLLLPVQEAVPQTTASRGPDLTPHVLHSPSESFTPPGAEAAGAKLRSETHLSPHATPFFPHKTSKAPGAHRQIGQKFQPFPEGMPLAVTPSTSLDASQESFPEADDPPESAD